MINVVYGTSKLIPKALLTSSSAKTELVCFGMLCNLPMTCPQNAKQRARPLPLESRIFLDDRNVFVTGDHPHNIGTLDQRTADILKRMAEQNGVVLQFRISFQHQMQQQLSSKNSKAKRSASALSVVIYGPVEYFDDIGDFLLKCELYLQDPVGCDRNVRYCNPQSLWSIDDEEVRMTQDIKPPPVQDFEYFQNPADLLEDLEYEDALPESCQPSALKTQLYP